MINYIQGEDLFNHIKEYDVILIGTGIKNSKGDGFQYKIARSLKYVYNKLNETKYDDKNKFGTCLVVPSQYGFPTFVYCFICKSRYRVDKNPDTLDYDALKSCLEIVNKNFVGCRIASTLLGHNENEGCGDKKVIMSIFENACKDIDIDVYDYKQKTMKEEDDEIWYGLKKKFKEGIITKEEYIKGIKTYRWQRRFGVYSDAPDSLSNRELSWIFRDQERLAQFLIDNGYNENGWK